MSGACHTGWPSGRRPAAFGRRDCCRGEHGGSPCCRFGIRASWLQSDVGRSLRLFGVSEAVVDCAAVTARVCRSQPTLALLYLARSGQAARQMAAVAASTNGRPAVLICAAAERLLRGGSLSPGSDLPGERFGIHSG